MIAVLVALAGGIGATLRVVVDAAVSRRWEGTPLGIPVVNVTGSFLMGLLVGSFAAGDVTAVLGTGLLGGYTTFSAASLEAVRLARTKRRMAAVGYAVGTLALGVGAAALGLWLTAG